MLATLSFFSLSIFLCLLRVSVAEVAETKLGAPSDSKEFEDVISESELIGPAASQVLKDLRGVSQWYYNLQNRAKRTTMRMEASKNTRMMLRKKEGGTTSKQLNSTGLYQLSARWTTSELNSMIAKIDFPAPESTVDRVLLMTALGTNNVELFRIIWKRSAWGYEDGYFAMIAPDRADDRYWFAYYLGPRKESALSKFLIRVDKNKLDIEMDDRLMVNAIELSNYSSSQLLFQAGVAIYDYMASSPSSLAVVYIAELIWS